MTDLVFEEIKIKNNFCGPFASIYEGKLVFIRDEKVIPYDSYNPDGGRGIYHAATVRVKGKTYTFEYREKYYEGLVAFENGQRLDELPEWATQEQD
jgi:hypothetical protein